MYTDLFWCMGTNANIQMCKSTHGASPEKHGVSDSERLSQLRVIHKLCVLSQWGTGASSASSPCQIRVLGAAENLPDTGLHCHTRSQHCHTLAHYLRIRSTAQLSQGDRPGLISTDAVRVNCGWSNLQLRYSDCRIEGRRDGCCSLRFSRWISRHVYLQEALTLTFVSAEVVHVYTLSAVTIDMWQQPWPSWGMSLSRSTRGREGWRTSTKLPSGKLPSWTGRCVLICRQWWLNPTIWCWTNVLFFFIWILLCIFIHT